MNDIKKKYDKDFIDENGEKSTLHIESLNNYDSLKLKDNNYKLSNSILNKKSLFNMKKNSIFSKDIGVKSKGFAQVASLSLLVALSCIFIFYLMFRY